MRLLATSGSRNRQAWAPLLIVLLTAACGAAPQRSPVSPVSAERAAYVAAQMVGHPYRYGGNNPRGFDCSGLIEYSYRQAGVSLPRSVRGQRAAVQILEHGSLRPGDLLFFDTRAGKSAHVGIYLGQGTFVHAPSSGKRVMRSTLANPYWGEHLVLAGRVSEN